MTEETGNGEGGENGEIEFSQDSIDEAARKVIHIERRCFYGDEPERDRLKKIRDELEKLISNKD